MKKVLNNLLLIFLFPLRKLKNTKIDNFAGGLIFGAVFSLFVNVATIKIQEVVNRQRALEALEREIMYQSIDLNNSAQNLVNLMEKMKNGEKVYKSIAFMKRYPTRVWESNDAFGYLLELEPDTVAELESYYAYVEDINLILDWQEKDFDNLFEKCTPEYTLLGNESASQEYCNSILLQAIGTHLDAIEDISKKNDSLQSKFHPTRDRLSSRWLSLILGNKSVEILK